MSLMHRLLLTEIEASLWPFCASRPQGRNDTPSQTHCPSVTQSLYADRIWGLFSVLNLASASSKPSSACARWVARQSVAHTAFSARGGGGSLGREEGGFLPASGDVHCVCVWGGVSAYGSRTQKLASS